MGRMLMRLAALAVAGIVVHRALHMIGVLGGDDDIDFEWADDAPTDAPA